MTFNVFVVLYLVDQVFGCCQYYNSWNDGNCFKIVNGLFHRLMFRLCVKMNAVMMIFLFRVQAFVMALRVLMIGKDVCCLNATEMRFLFVLFWDFF
jgi:hypothetical protein